MPFSYVEQDSAISRAVIEAVLANPIVKQLLSEIVSRLKQKVFDPLVVQENQGPKPNLSSLAMQHASGDKYIGALLPRYPAEYLEQEGRELLLTAIGQRLDSATHITTIHDFLSLMKVIDGMAFIFDEVETSKENRSHALCKSHIAPTTEEVAIRARRPNAVLARTYGIGTEDGQDLVPRQAAVHGSFSGKARFFIPPPDQRLVTWFEKLALQRTTSNPPLPLIASPSNAAAKVFMVAHELGLFINEDNQLDLNKAQIFANCVMAYLVYCGHHSFLEVVEIWNRLLDFWAIECPSLLPDGTIPREPTTLPYMQELNAVERKLPYGIIGDYVSFLHPIYRGSVLSSMQTLLENGLQLGFDSTITEADHGHVEYRYKT